MAKLYAFLTETIPLPPDQTPSILARLAALEAITIQGPSVLLDGHTIGWYRANKAQTVTSDATTHKVTRWADFLGSGRDFIDDPANAGFQPVYTGNSILFESGPRMWQPLVKNGPLFIYAKAKVYGDDQGNILFANKVQVASDQLYAYMVPDQTGKYLGMGGNTGNFANLAAPIPIDQYAIVRCLFDGENSKSQVNEGDVATGNLTSTLTGTLVLANNYSDNGNGNASHIEYKEFLIRDSPLGETEIYNYLKTV